MNGGPAVSRFLARQDARGTWMVWDRERRQPVDPQSLTTRLTEQEAKELAEQLEADPSTNLTQLVMNRARRG
jgi:hypothetical protein